MKDITKEKVQKLAQQKSKVCCAQCGTLLSVSLIEAECSHTYGSRRPYDSRGNRLYAIKLQCPNEKGWFGFTRHDIGYVSEGFNYSFSLKEITKQISSLT